MSRELRVPITCSHCKQTFAFSDLGLVPQTHLPYIAIFLRCPHCSRDNPRRQGARAMRIAVRGLGGLLMVSVLALALGKLWVLVAGALSCVALLWADERSFERKVSLHAATTKSLDSTPGSLKKIT
jgi:hypothetical protein